MRCAGIRQSCGASASSMAIAPQGLWEMFRKIKNAHRCEIGFPQRRVLTETYIRMFAHACLQRDDSLASRTLRAFSLTSWPFRKKGSVFHEFFRGVGDYSHSPRLNALCVIYVCLIPSGDSDSLWYSYFTACTTSSYRFVIRVITGETVLLWRIEDFHRYSIAQNGC